MLENPVFEAAKAYDPDVYNSAIAALDEEAKTGASPESLAGRISTRVVAIELKRLSTAQDEAVISFERVTTREIRELNVKNSEACFAWLFPAKGQSVQLNSYLEKPLIDESHQALAKVIESSAKNPQPTPALGDVSSDLQLVRSDLRKYYGDKVELLAHIHDPNVDKQAVCDMVATLKSNIAGLPEERAGRPLRYIYSKQ
jgi:hypothetical protein